MDQSSTEFTVWSYVAALILLILLTVVVFVLAIVVAQLRKAYRKLKKIKEKG